MNAKKKILSLPLLVATGVLVMSGCMAADTSPVSPPKTTRTTSKAASTTSDKQIYVGRSDDYLSVRPGKVPELEVWSVGSGGLTYMRYACDGAYTAMGSGTLDSEVRITDGPGHQGQRTVHWFGVSPLNPSKLTTDLDVTTLGSARVLVPNLRGSEYIASAQDSTSLRFFADECSAAGEPTDNFTATHPNNQE